MSIGPSPADIATAALAAFCSLTRPHLPCLARRACEGNLQRAVEAENKLRVLTKSPGAS
jgi:hypothetical protein